ncbi:MAG: hypothetical protein ACTIAM_07385 [Pseudolactococcus laudensis]|uniref:hypothetical protein n=1 Tax=Pseudolactococcus laudensis TaxID=1494461 RepID=UPI003F9DD0ED
MKKEKYAKLFKAIVGRELTPQEFLQAKKNDFDPKQIKKIAGLTVENPDTVSETASERQVPVSDKTVEKTSEKIKNITQLTEDQVSQPSKPATKKKVPTKLIVAIVAVLVVAAGIFGFVKTRPVDVTKDIKVTFSGYDGYGTATYNSDKVHQIITEKLAAKAGFSKAESHQLISMNSLSGNLTNTKYRAKATKLMDWISDLSITFDAGSNLKNGDKVTFKIKPGKGTPLKAVDKTYTVKGLKKTKKVSASSLTKGKITFSGYNGNGSVKYDDNKFEIISNDKSGTLSNGDELEFEFTQDYIDTLLTEGKSVTDKTFEVKVSGLKDINDISKVDTLYSKIPELVKEDYKDKPAGEYGSYDLTYKIEPQKSFIKVSEDSYDDETRLSLVITYKITKTQTWVKDDTWDNKKKGDVETKEIYTYFGYQNVKIYKDAVVLSDLSKTYGSTWSNYLDIDAVYADLEKSGYGDYQPKN